MRTVNIGLCGLGTVGGGTVRIINRHHDDFLRHAGVDLRIARVCSRHDGMAKELGLYNIWTSDYRDIVNDPDIDIVVELIGGTETAKSVVIDSLNAGKNVVTANKALMASCGHDIFEAADAHDVEVAFEASVGGGIPIIEPLKHSLVSNEITSVLGIVNGTTNYMLTLMDEEGMQKTKNNLIYIGHPIQMNEEQFRKDLEMLDEASKAEDPHIKDLVAKVVPTYHPDDDVTLPGPVEKKAE